MASQREEDILTAQVAQYTTQIATADAEIVVIDAETFGVNSQVCADARKVALEAEKAVLQPMLTAKQTRLTALQAGWSAPRQTVIDEINTNHPNVHDYGIVQLLLADSAEQDTFFNAYGDAANDAQKDVILAALL